MRAAVVAGSRLEGPLDEEALDRADLLVAADGGADALAAVGRRPDLLVGDMDSIDPGTLARLEAQGVETVLLPEAKDETDLETALRVVVGRGATEVTVFGALGGPRLDHLVGTMLLLTAPWLEGVRVRLVDPWHEVFLATGHARIEGRAGDTVSLLPLSEIVRDVRTEGLRYPLQAEDLRQDATRGVSNSLTGKEALVEHGAGRLLVIHYRSAREPSVHFEEER